MKIDLSADELELIVTSLKFVEHIHSEHIEHSAEAYECRLLIDKLMSPTLSSLLHDYRSQEPNRSNPEM